MIDLGPVREALAAAGMERWAALLPDAYAQALDNAHGKLEHWRRLLGSLPSVPATDVRLDTPAVAVGDAGSLNETVREEIATALMALHPWRKGPFSIHGVEVDSEWRSDLKWDRVRSHIRSLEGRVVLDVGAGNGYYAWRMAGEGAKLVIGVEPGWLYLVQFLAVAHFLGQDAWPVHLLPFGIEDVPPGLRAFDTVFSMGVFYHRRSPIDHLLELRSCLKPGGELVLETLVLEGELGSVLVPEGRYAKMRNLWFIPSLPTLESWLKRCGFRDVRVCDVTPTTTAEQRSTPWMRFESLKDFLDPRDASLTVEGYPAPLRAVLVAHIDR